MKKVRLMSLVAAMVVAGMGTSYAADIKISGYIQAQYVNAGTDTTISNDPIHIRRARIKVEAKKGDSLGCIQIDGAKDNQISLKDAYLQHTFTNGVKVAMGQMKLPVSYTVLRSSSKRELPERPLVTQKLYKGERDRGITISGKLAEIAYTIGAFNGMGVEETWKDNNDKKDITARLTGAVQDLQWGISVYQGNSGTDTTKDKNRTGVELRYTFPTKTELTGEYIKGKDGKKDAEGWYILATHPLIENLIGAIRYDTYDPDKDTSKDATDTLGISLVYQLDEAMKVTLAYLDPDEEGTEKKNTETTLRLQFKY